MSHHPYFGAFVMLVFSFTLFQIVFKLQRFVSRRLARRGTDRLRSAPYECGPVPIRQQNRISHHFYVMAVLFILFDVEVVFMMPWALGYRGLGVLGFIEMMIFLMFLVVGFLYALKRGALHWQDMM